MKKLLRRNFINITASCFALATLPISLKAKETKTIWQGQNLGADSSMTLFHQDENYSKKVIKEIQIEIKRLEKIFSLYDKNSVISQLNKKGRLLNPPKELVEVLNFANLISTQSNGAFDISIQPLWNIYVLYSNKPDVLNKKIKKNQKLINYKNIYISEDEISFKKKGMSITLNGIAQGYITDKISKLLKTKGFTNVLVDLGEIKALGKHPQSRKWNISTPYLQNKKYLKIENEAIASSGAYGTRFNYEKHHIFDPKTSLSSNEINSVTVIAKSAMLADAISTSLAVLKKEKREEFLNNYKDVKVYFS